MNLVETKGILLFTRDHKEKDKLVKIFTESAGKQMFYVKGAHRKNNPLTPALLSYTEATYIGNVRLRFSCCSVLGSHRYGPTVRSADKQKAALIIPRNTMASYAKSIGP